ncbi:MAG: DUF1016 family protein [Bacteroidetes bacterium]|nr:DUF1016 family protein [Bacteroidota bacterium]
MNFEQLVHIFEQTHSYLQSKAISAVNQSLTIRNWLFGYYIMEYEQNGEDRARYGEKLLKQLSQKLEEKKIKSTSYSYLKTYRQFYNTYRSIGQTLSGQLVNDTLSVVFPEKTSTQLFLKLVSDIENSVKPELLISRLSFSHIVELLRADTSLKRMFYEVQAIKGNWSVTELKRQMGSLLYERTGLSVNKDGLMADVNKEAEPLTPVGIMRDPFVFEFVGLKPKEKYNESKLEEALIEHLQEFLLELGKGFCFEARQKRLTIDMEKHNRIEIVKEAILKIFFFLEKDYYYSSTYKIEDSNIFNESLDIEYIGQIKRRKVVISYTMRIIPEGYKCTFGMSITRLPYSGYSDFFSMENYLQSIGKDFSTTLIFNDEVKDVKKVLEQMKEALIENVLEVIKGNIWFENYYPKKD